MLKMCERWQETWKQRCEKRETEAAERRKERGDKGLEARQAERVSSPHPTVDADL